MSKVVDAMGKACPMPVVMAKKEIDNGCKELEVIVDNDIAVENLKKLAAKYQMQTAVTVNDEERHVLFTLDGNQSAVKDETASVSQVAAPVCSPAGCGTVVFIGKEYVGDGDHTLGKNLMKMFLYTLSQEDVVPAGVCFMNGGVKITVEWDDDVIDSIRTLIEKGCEVLVCGTCLNFYGIADQLKVGQVSNMYDIVEKMQSGAKVITV